MPLYATEGGAPTTPAATKQAIWLDSTEHRWKVKDQYGQTYPLQPADARGRNLIVNPAFGFAQRQVPGTLTTYSSGNGRAFCADQWCITNENASVQFQRAEVASAPETGLLDRFYGTFKKISSNGKFTVSQVIEANDGIRVRGRTVRVQLKIKSSASRTMRVALLELSSAGTTDTIPGTFITAHNSASTDPTWGTNLAALTPVSAITGTISGAGMSCAVTTAWQQFSATFSTTSTTKNFVLVIFSDAQVVVNDTVSIAEVGLYDGPEIREWAPLPWELELIRCQRFYAKTFPIDTAPAQSAGLTGAIRFPVTIAGASAGCAVVTWAFPVRMRGTPTMTYFNPSNADAFVRNVTAGTNATATASIATSLDDKSVGINCTGLAAWTVGQELAVHATAEGGL